MKKSGVKVVDLQATLKLAHRDFEQQDSRSLVQVEDGGSDLGKVEPYWTHAYSSAVVGSAAGMNLLGSVGQAVVQTRAVEAKLLLEVGDLVGVEDLRAKP